MGLIKNLYHKLKEKRGITGITTFANHDGAPSGVNDRPGIERIFWSHEGPIVHKWHHYLPIYERYFSPYRNRKIRFLEIGVSKGGSLSLWRKYFGPDAIIFGIDIDPKCAELNGIDGQVRIGSQDDPEFLKKVLKEMGGVDVILDDGSHFSKHIRASFNTLFPLLDEGGVYMVEDLHATYWRSHKGAYQKTNSFIGDIRQMYDDMHHWYHNEGQKVGALGGKLSSIHLHDSIVVFNKNTVPRPSHSEVGAAK